MLQGENKRMKKWHTAGLVPIYFALAFILLNMLFVGALSKALTPEAQELFFKRQTFMWLSSALFLIPNVILSFLLQIYKNSHPEANRELYTLCFIAITTGVIPQLLIYALYYDLWYAEGANLPVVIFGFPVVYLLGMMLGWVIGLGAVYFRRR